MMIFSIVDRFLIEQGNFLLERIQLIPIDPHRYVVVLSSKSSWFWLKSRLGPEE